ncbi:hypothetical protein Ddye_025716 [Dipteronia dyeriana]|uniref:Leucine-rich repeat-containing N-terminal plant-type domain-containing protein n=1 Tax=Dipteronia dyeriana TaxID=168575 RepID=A0AAD9WNS7_9ROSI|nr:hypothetical protein Ddye_025716 [Dipteronia dyeriana]
METNQTLRLFVFFFVLHSLASGSSLSTKHIITDRDALLALKALITHDPATLLAQNWSTNTSVCNWIGVTCGVRHHRVTALNISYLGLVGTIPSQIGNFSFLALLSINDNNFYGSLPYELSRLHRLKYINFNYNQLSEEAYQQLQRRHTKRNRHLTKLKTLSIGDNKLEGEIPLELGNLIELERLTLRDNVLLTRQIPSLLFNISSLRQINLTNNSLTGDLPHNMCSHHHHPSVLEILALSNNQLTGTIPYNLWQCRELTIVSLSHNQFRGRIPRDIGNLTMVKTLALGGDIPFEIGNLPNLEQLGLESGNLVGHIPATVFNISTLKILGLHNNTLSGSLPSFIGFGLPNVERLTLDMNNLTGKFPSFITNA